MLNTHYFLSKKITFTNILNSGEGFYFWTNTYFNSLYATILIHHPNQKSTHKR